MKNFGVKQLALLFLFIVSGLQLSAQNGSDNDVAALKQFITKVYQDGVTNLTTSNVNELLKNFDRSFVGSAVDVALDGKVEVKEMNIESLTQTLNSLAKNEVLDVKWSIESYHSAVVKGKTGAVSFDIQYSLVKNGQVISSGVNSMDVITRKTMKGWKISYSSTIQVEETRNMGNCYCEIYSQGKTDFLTLLLMPDGSEYTESTDKFKVAESGARRVIKVNGEDIYEWNKKTGEISIEGSRVGEAKRQETAIRAILKFVNAEKCQRIVTNN